MAPQTELPTVWADESSWTGENLVDPAQPVYAIGAVLLDDDFARGLVSRVRAVLPETMGEAKYTTVVNSEAGRAELIAALREIPAGGARTYLAHKPYMVAAKMIDLLIEPLAYANGYDMYADGSAPALANLLHLVGPVLGAKAEYEQMLRAFVATVRARPRLGLSELFTSIDAYLATCTSEWREQIAILSASRNEAEDLLRLIHNERLRDSLDPAVPCLVALCLDVGKRLTAFRLVHDTSNVLARHALELLHLDRLMDVTRPGHRQEPLPAVDITFAESKSVPQLQIADWVAGAARQWATQLFTERPDPFANRLAPVVNPWLIGGLWPDMDAVIGPDGAANANNNG